MEKVSNISFEKYLRKVIEVAECNPLEINYQLEIVKPFLEELLLEYQIPDTSNNSESKEGTKNPKHNRYYYTLKNGAAPDLLIAKNYRYKNKSNKPDIFAVVEVKHQSSSEMLNRELVHKESGREYAIHIVNELATYMCVNNKAIATNCRRWQFFDKAKSKIFDVVFLKEYLSIVGLLCSVNSKKFKESPNYYIDKLWNAIEVNKQLAGRCKELLGEKKSEQWYVVCVSVLEKCTRSMVESCLCETIDVLPNSGVIKENAYIESVDLNIKESKELIEQTIIKTPKEWDELIKYIPLFVNPK